MEAFDGPCIARRCLLTGAGAGAAAVALVGCSTYGAQSTPPAPSAAQSGAAQSGAGPGASSGTGTGGDGTTVLAGLADIPIGGGKVLADRGMVVTRPKAGTVKAFSTVCTHAGCAVNEVAGGTINCPCHGSKYAIADGSVVAGPAPRPLPSIAVKVQGDKVVAV